MLMTVTDVSQFKYIALKCSYPVTVDYIIFCRVIPGYSCAYTWLQACCKI